MNPPTEDRVSEIAQEIADRSNLRVQQTALYKRQREHRLAAPLRRKLKKVERLRRSTRHRIHFGKASRFVNGVNNTFAGESPKGKDYLYFQFESGQIVRADKILRRGKNPVVKALVMSEVEANAKRT